VAHLPLLDNNKILNLEVFNYMQLKEVIIDRRSIQQFKDKKVEVDIIEDLLNAAVWVPNHKMTQPWRFVLVHGDARKKIAETARSFNEAKEKDPEKKKIAGQKSYDKIMSVPMFLVVVISENPNPLVREEDSASASCIIQNLSLLLWEKGIGMIWKSYQLMFSETYRDVLDIKPGEKVVGSLHIGYPETIPNPRERKPINLTIME
jgi:nitroreductase